MREVVLKLIALVIIAGLAGVFGGCSFACDSDDDHSASFEMHHCVAHCGCHSFSLATSLPVVIAPLEPQSHRLLDEELSLPVFVADIFNPPKA